MLAVGFATTNLAGFYHFATVTHVRCAEHGEEMDAPLAPHHTMMVGDAWLPAGDKAPAGHDHCHIDPWTHDRRSAKHTVQLSVPLTRTAMAPAWALIDCPRAVSVYGMAPKTSPPVA
ncbi:MAG TPA: hypothetical protein VFG83_14510 [Kofleriaceae bacterium]|nr:hypothetical protein [Kofleriaceae bacterium]